MESHLLVKGANIARSILKFRTHYNDFSLSLSAHSFIRLKIRVDLLVRHILVDNFFKNSYSLSY